jgi:hypothetical protein
MNDDVKLIITGTFAIITLAWVVTHASDIGTISTQGASAYATATAAILPKNT